MPSRAWKLRIQGILESVSAIESYVAGKTFDEFALDQKTIDAVVRRFAVIGEAANHVPEDVSLCSAQIPWADMRAMRNFTVHEYFGVSEDILWDTITEDLPGILRPLQQLLGQETG